MPNQLGIPFKITYSIPIKQAVRDYLLAHGDVHPSAFKWDINRWEALRKDGVGGVVHVDRVSATLTYHAQLLSVVTKLPANIQLEIPYQPVFAKSGLPISLCNLAYERAAVLFNLAALYSQLAASENRESHDGVKRASSHYQNAAGTLSYLLNTSGLLASFATLSEEDALLDLTESFVKSLEWLMLAQAQECAWQKAVLDHYKNGVIAKLAAKVSSLYRSALTTIREASPAISHVFPSEWLAHIETKQYHFQAASQLRKSSDNLESNRYGYELARLLQAQTDAKKGYDIARRGRVAQDVLNDIKSVLDKAQENLTRAQRDNDYIYHQDVPMASALPPIDEISVVKSSVPLGLSAPKTILGEEHPLFGELLGWGAKEAINIYNHQKEMLIREQVIDVARELDDKANEVLRSLNLPSSLEALEKPIGLPPSLLKMAEEVRLEEGPTRIEASIEDVQKLAIQDMNILNEAMDILDTEASEDEIAGLGPVGRLPSHQANRDFIAKEQRYRQIIEQAASTDENVRRKWDEWSDNITELASEKAVLEASVPSSTIPVQGRSSSKHSQTQIHARALRVLLESLDDGERSRAQLVERAKRLAESDDIHPRILRAASGFEQWADVQPSMFQDVSDNELEKYDKFIQDIADSETKQAGVLADITARNEQFLQSRQDDPSVKEREHALQSLHLAYHKYREIIRNLDEGLKFYNDLATIFTQFRESCKNWSNMRKQEIISLSDSLDSMSLLDDQEVEDEQLDIAVEALPKSTKNKLTLPSLNSAEWETVDVPAGPTAKSRQSTKKRR